MTVKFGRSVMDWVFIVLALFVAIGCLLLGLRSCRNRPTVQPSPLPSSSSSSVAVVDAAPESSSVASVSSSSDAALPLAPWKPVKALGALQGHWDSSHGKDYAEFYKASKAHSSLYPWELIVLAGNVSTKPFNCGFYGHLNYGGDSGEDWRVAWCHGGNLDKGSSYAMRLVLMVSRKNPHRLIVQLADKFRMEVSGPSK